MGLLLPRTDPGALAQVVVVVALGLPAFVIARRRSGDLAWLVTGLVAVALGLFAFRTLH